VVSLAIWHDWLAGFFRRGGVDIRFDGDVDASSRLQGHRLAGLVFESILDTDLSIEFIRAFNTDCAFSGSLGWRDGMIFSTVPGRVTDGFSVSDPLSDVLSLNKSAPGEGLVYSRQSTKLDRRPTSEAMLMAVETGPLRLTGQFPM
jgi:hypothetical protein